MYTILLTSCFRRQPNSCQSFDYVLRRWLIMSGTEPAGNEGEEGSKSRVLFWVGGVLMPTPRKPTVPTAEAIDQFCGSFDRLFARREERQAFRQYLIGLL